MCKVQRTKAWLKQ